VRIFTDAFVPASEQVHYLNTHTAILLIMLVSVPCVSCYLEQNKRDNLHNVTFRRLREILLPWKNNKYYIVVCVRACVRQSTCACACM
jgi:hypothetical protein